MQERTQTVLIVDDDESIGKAMTLMLENEGFKTEVARNGEKALEKVKSNVYDVALLDINLPDIEGTHLLKAIREVSPNTVKIMLTGNAELRTSLDALNWGADAYLIKPMNPNEIICTIKEKLKEAKAAEIMTEQKMTVFLKQRTQKLLQETK